MHRTFDATRLSRAAVCLLVCPLIACHSHDDHGHEHGSHGDHAEEAEAPPVSITRWTESYELFVELPQPVAEQPIEYHAHVTRLSDFQAVREGIFVARYKTKDGAVAREHRQTGVKRPGIFVFEGAGLATGTYDVEMAYEHEGKTDVWDCGPIEVVTKAPEPKEEPADTSITFLKESQWKVDFRTAWSEERTVRQQLELTGVVEPAAADQLVITATTTGRFLHDPKRVLAVGARVEKGEVLGTIVPSVDEDYAALVFSAEEASIAKRQTDADIARVEPLVEQGVLPERRLIELRNERELITSRQSLAARRLGAAAGSGGAGLVVKADRAGVITELIAVNGSHVDAGTPVLRIGSSDRLWVRGTTFARGPFTDPEPSSVRASGGAPYDLVKPGALLLSPSPVIDPETRVGRWFVDLVAAAPSLPPELRAGASVVVTVRHGREEPAVVVPAGAVVEIDTRPYVFVQIDGEHFEKRLITAGPRDGEFIPIRRGVRKEERVVTLGGFDIHLAAVMGTVESHRH